MIKDYNNRMDEPIYNVEVPKKGDKEDARHLNKRIDELLAVIKKNGTAINKNTEDLNQAARLIESLSDIITKQ